MPFFESKRSATNRQNYPAPAESPTFPVIPKKRLAKKAVAPASYPVNHSDAFAEVLSYSLDNSLMTGTNLNPLPSTLKPLGNSLPFDDAPMPESKDVADSTSANPDMFAELVVEIPKAQEEAGDTINSGSKAKNENAGGANDSDGDDDELFNLRNFDASEPNVPATPRHSLAEADEQFSDTLEREFLKNPKFGPTNPVHFGNVSLKTAAESPKPKSAAPASAHDQQTLMQPLLIDSETPPPSVKKTGCCSGFSLPKKMPEFRCCMWPSSTAKKQTAAPLDQFMDEGSFTPYRQL